MKVKLMGNGEHSYLTAGKVYEVLPDVGLEHTIVDDEGDMIGILISHRFPCSHVETEGLWWEVVEE